MEPTPSVNHVLTDTLENGRAPETLDMTYNTLRMSTLHFKKDLSSVSFQKNSEKHGFFETIPDSHPLCMGSEKFLVRFELNVKIKKTMKNMGSLRHPDSLPLCIGSGKDNEHRFFVKSQTVSCSARMPLQASVLQLLAALV